MNKFERMLHLGRGFLESDTTQDEYPGGVEEQEKCAYEHYGRSIKAVADGETMRDVYGFWRIIRKSKKTDPPNS